MENKVIMSLKDYNALKRKADALESAIALRVYDNYVECNVDPKVLYPHVKAQFEELVQQGEIDSNKFKLKPAGSWYIFTTVAKANEE